VRPRQSQPSVGFARVGILEEEDIHIGGLLLSFPAQTALARLECLRFGWIAIAGNEVSAQNQRGEQCYGNQKVAHSQSLYLRLVFLSSEALGAAARRRRGNILPLLFRIDANRPAGAR